jgi:hypothetical protein
MALPENAHLLNLKLSCPDTKLSHVIWHCQYHIVWVPKYPHFALCRAKKGSDKMTDGNKARVQKSGTPA